MKKNSLRLPAVISVVLFVLTLIPIILIAPFGHATGDDLGYGAHVMQALREGTGVAGALSNIAGEIVSKWYTWQGTWASIFLFCIEPSVFGEKFYTIVPLLAVAMFCIGTGYFLYHFLTRVMRISGAAFVTIFSLLSILAIQYMPYMRGGIFWYTSIAHYLIPYCAAMVSAVFADRFLQSGQNKYLAGMCLLMTYLGGASYPAIVLSLELTLLLILYAAADGRMSRRRLLILLPLALMLAGFAVSAAAPGNKVRGGEGFGSRGAAGILMVIVNSVKVCAVRGVRYFLQARPLILLLPITLGFAAEGCQARADAAPAAGTAPDCAMPENAAPAERMSGECGEAGMPRLLAFLRYPVTVAVLCFLTAAGVYAPEVYSAVDVSGGVPDTEYFVTLVMLVVALSYAGCALRRRADRASRRQEASACSASRQHILNIAVFFGALVLCAVFGKHLIGNSVDYTCYTFWKSGQLSDYTRQMEEKLSILQSDDTGDVLVPEMNNEQGPFMCMAEIDDPDNFNNASSAAFYGKRSVTAVPRQELVERGVLPPLRGEK
ncbi:MAG: hypothetical protein PUF49_02260 [Firmicutes bacterium]|nr:hypothetical protein [Bacillota bacterium]